MELMTSASSADIGGAGARVAVLPIGSFEQHGYHLPMTTDTVIACLIANQLAQAYPLLLLPPVTISCSHEHEQFPGTVSLSPATVIAIISDIRRSLERAGITRLVVVNAHGGNYVLHNIGQEANTSGRRVAVFPGHDDWNKARQAAGMETDPHTDMHGGELETSILLHARPDLVQESFRYADHEVPDRPHLQVLGIHAYTYSGIIGRPSAATETKGKAALDALTEAFDAYFTLLTVGDRQP
jgi:creatinine amidohydrolase